VAARSQFRRALGIAWTRALRAEGVSRFERLKGARERKEKGKPPPVGKGGMWCGVVGRSLYERVSLNPNSET
jgi:hypothetical protein